MHGGCRRRSWYGEPSRGTARIVAMMAIDRKLLRDLWRTRAQVASIALVLAGGVLAVVSIRGTASSLVLARDEYYAVGHFADVFATLTRAPDEIRARLA